MTTWSYIALEPTGQRKTGFVDAATKDAAIQSVAASGRFVLEIKEEKAGHSAAKNKLEGKRKGKVSRSDVALFSRRMADLAEAGLPLDRVLQVVAEQSESVVLTEIAEHALNEVRGGKPVSEALGAYPKYFPAVYTQTLKAGEASGQFGEVAGRLADFQEKEVARRSQVVSALIYPSILSFTAVFVVIFLLTFVVPRLSGVFKDLGDDLPGSTKILLASTDFLTKQWYIVIGGIVAGIVGYRAWSATESGGLARDRMVMYMPVLGPVIRKSTVSRFARVLGTLVYGGVPILDGIRLAGLAAGNRVFQKSAADVEADVREGRGIAEAMRDTAAFPPVLTHMVAIGEETGDLPKMLGRVSDSLDFEVDNGMRRLTSLVEPIIVLTMGVFVGFVVLSVLLPIFQAQELVK
jgi:type II secretory pathway component PulF